MANSKMVKSKRKWTCKACSTDHMKWFGICRQCGGINTLEEVILIPQKKKASLSQRSILNRSKRAERNIAKRMLEVDGPDPNFRGIASSTGRVGMITNMQFDAISKSYTTEVKNRKLPLWLNKAWIQIQQRAIDFNRNAMLYIEPSNMAKTFPLNGQNHKTSNLVIITQERHEELIRAEKELHGTK